MKVPSVASMSNTKISDIPIEVRRRIICELCTIPTPPPLDPTLSSRKEFTQKLPIDLLSPALSAYPLSAAVADALGSRAAYLTAEAAGNALPRWITALAPYVRAVILDSSRINYRDVLLASTREHVSLRVLHVNFWNHRNLSSYNTNTLEHALVSTLHHSASSLRELSLSVHRFCERALRKVDLPNLEVIQFMISRDKEVRDNQYQRNIFKHMILAVGVASFRQREASCIHDMRLVNCVVPPFTNESWHRLIARHAYLEPFFHGIKSFHVVIQKRHDDDYRYGGRDSDQSGDISSFLKLLSGLRCLHLEYRAGTEKLSSRSIQQITDACPNIEEIHMMNVSIAEGKCSDGHGCSWIDGHHMSKECFMESLAHRTNGTLRKFCTKHDYIGHIAEYALDGYFSNLEEFRTELHLSGIDSLTEILENCRKLRVLGLNFRAEYGDGDEPQLKAFGALGLAKLSKAIRSASDILTNLFIGLGSQSSPAGESYTEGTMVALTDILKWMGKRASKVQFILRLATVRGAHVVDSLCRLLDTAACHNQNLEEFHVHLSLWTVSSFMWTHSNEEEEMLTKLAIAREHLKQSAPCLHRIIAKL